MTAHAVMQDNHAFAEKCWQVMSDLKGVYDVNGWQMGIFSLEDGTVQWVGNAMQVVRTETL